MRFLAFALTIIFLTSVNAKANCTASFLSDPDSIFGQTFDCDDGSTLTYQRNSVFGDTITNNNTGEVFSGSFLSTVNDEYNSIFGRSFDSGSGSLTLDRNSVFGDTIKFD